MSVDLRLEIAHAYARDLETETDEEIQLLHRLFDELQLKKAMNLGATAVVRDQLAETYRTTEALLKRMHTQRELLIDLRAVLADVASSIKRMNRAERVRPERVK